MRFLLKFTLPAAFLFASFAITGCKDNAENEQLKQSTNNLELYVDSLEKVHKGQELQYTEAEWQSIDSGYEARRSSIEMQMEGDEEHAETDDKLDEIETRYHSLHTEYEQQRKARMDEAARGVEAARDALGIPGAGADATHITAQNFLQHFENFVNTVDQYKKVFSTNDWAKIQAYKEVIDMRQEAVNEKFTADDRMKIAELETRYSTLKLHKIGAKIEEETDNND